MDLFKVDRAFIMSDECSIFYIAREGERHGFTLSCSEKAIDCVQWHRYLRYSLLFGFGDPHFVNGLDCFVLGSPQKF